MNFSFLDKSINDLQLRFRNMVVILTVCLETPLYYLCSNSGWSEASSYSMNQQRHRELFSDLNSKNQNTFLKWKMPEENITWVILGGVTWMPQSSLNSSQAERCCHRHIFGCCNLYQSRPSSLLRVTAQQWTGIVSLKHWKTSLFSYASQELNLCLIVWNRTRVSPEEKCRWGGGGFSGGTPEGVASRFFEGQLYL